MPADPHAVSQQIDHHDPLNKRIWLTAFSALALVIGQCAILIWLLRGINLRYPLLTHVLHTTTSLLPAILAGLLVYAALSAYRNRDGRYLRSLARPGSISMLVVLFGTLVLLTVFYTTLKAMVPLLHDRTFDEHLWRIDSVIFFGMSPNVFFISLLDQSLLLRFIDWVYGYLFFFAVSVSFPLFLPHRDDRLRVSFITANVLLWSSGAWLYLAVPSLGPAFGYHEVWDAVREQFPVSMYWQKQLVENYQIVLRIPQGTIDPGFSVFEGIGAFPSMHVGFQTLFALYLGRLSRYAGRAAWLLVFLTFLGSILTGWHYLVDSIAGLLLAAGFFLLMERVVLPSHSGAADPRPARDL